MKQKYILSFYVLLLLSSSLHTAKASYLFKNILNKGLLYLLKKGATTTTAKAVGYGMPTIFAINKIKNKVQDQTIKENYEYINNIFFVYPFDENAQKQNVELRNEIVHYALQTMPDEWKGRSSAEELLQTISNDKEAALHKLKEVIDFKGSLPSWEERKQTSENSIAKFIHKYNENNPDTPLLHVHKDDSRPDLLEKVLAWCNQNGINNNAIQVAIKKYDINENYILNNVISFSTAKIKKNLKTPTYTLEISPEYIESTAPFVEWVKKHELNHLKTGDPDYDTSKFFYVFDKQEKATNNFPKSLNFKNIISYCKEFSSFYKDIQKVKTSDLKFRIQAEYHADINPILSDSTLTTQEKIEALKNYSHLFEHMLTFDAKKQIEAQQDAHHFFNRLQEGFGVNEHDIPLSYHLTKQDEPTHPSTLSRYQLIARAIQLLSEKVHEEIYTKSTIVKRET